MGTIEAQLGGASSDFSRPALGRACSSFGLLPIHRGWLPYPHLSLTAISSSSYSILANTTTESALSTAHLSRVFSVCERPQSCMPFMILLLIRDFGICFGRHLLLASNSCPGKPAVEVTAVAQVNEQGAVFVAECVLKSELAGASHLGF